MVMFGGAVPGFVPSEESHAIAHEAFADWWRGPALCRRRQLRRRRRRHRGGGVGLDPRARDARAGGHRPCRHRRARATRARSTSSSPDCVNTRRPVIAADDALNRWRDFPRLNDRAARSSTARSTVCSTSRSTFALPTSSSAWSSKGRSATVLDPPRPASARSWPPRPRWPGGRCASREVVEGGGQGAAAVVEDAQGRHRVDPDRTPAQHDVAPRCARAATAVVVRDESIARRRRRARARLRPRAHAVALRRPGASPQPRGQRVAVGGRGHATVDAASARW